MKKILTVLFLMSLLAPYSGANQFYPEFDKMKTMRCDIVETTFDANEKEISTTGYFRIFRLDEENKLLYLQKDFINGLVNYDEHKISFFNEIMTDDSIIRTSAEIDRDKMKYTSTSTVEFDNPDWGGQTSAAVGECKYL